MPIDLSKLEAWSKAPSDTEKAKIQHTHLMIREALDTFLPKEEIKQKYWLPSFDYETYLQGSYANSTNISYESDVDIVLQFNSIFAKDLSQLTPGEQEAFNRDHHDASYLFSEWKKDVFLALQSRFGDDVIRWKKCIEISSNTSRIKADIVPSFHHRIYQKYISTDNHQFLEWIKFENSETGENIYNFPRVHIQNCISKNQAVASFKSMVRVLKNMKAASVEKWLLEDKTVPSYFIENLLYNCPEHCFMWDLGQNLLKILQFVYDAHTQERLHSFICANEQELLFCEGKWNVDDALKFITAIWRLYLNKA